MALTLPPSRRFRARSTTALIPSRIGARARSATDLEREEQRYEAKRAALRTAIDEGDGIAEGNVFERVREKLNLPSSPR
jgi:hypothetical protein